ncbi:MAG: FKBP-type peptidyl-prolyl cis-trans isomerase [Candidatus Saccharibacteria bacterium]|nr:FKBP-type peptidyl-prolyl cis-trans isomerase [Candidatus Saccharibacteria bacterium]
MASSTSRGQRIFAWIGALLFLVTTIGFSIAVVWQMRNDSSKNAAQSAAQSATNTPKGNKLQGTKLSGFTPLTTVVSDIQKTDVKPGTGPAVKEGDTITAHYTGAVAKDGTIFQSSHDTGQPFSAPLAKGQLIEGWVEGLPGMQVGGTRRLVIPAAKAYGANPPAGSNIPVNADLVFDIELVKIGQ